MKLRYLNGEKVYVYDNVPSAITVFKHSDAIAMLREIFKRAKKSPDNCGDHLFSLLHTMQVHMSMKVIRLDDLKSGEIKLDNGETFETSTKMCRELIGDIRSMFKRIGNEATKRIDDIRDQLKNFDALNKLDIQDTSQIRLCDPVPRKRGRKRKTEKPLLSVIARKQKRDMLSEIGRTFMQEQGKNI